MDGAGYRWTEQAGNERSRLELDGEGWTEQGTNGRIRLQIDKGGCEWTYEPVNRQRRLEIDRGGCKWTDKAAKGWSRLLREGYLRNEIHRRLPGRLLARRGK